nr:nucleotidyltransferase family protein [uncultured Anaeromusa sp.]
MKRLVEQRMKNWGKVIVDRDATILEVLQIIDNESLQIALVVDKDRKLCGTVTDGDVRRALLRGISLQDKVTKIMNNNPVSMPVATERSEILDVMKELEIQNIPLVDQQNRVIGLESFHQLLKPVINDNWVVLMAGGLGSRLGELTRNCPKPLLKVGSKPILETILDNFISYGYRKFYISVNYKAELIEDYFGDGSKWGVEIRYLKEEKRLGTAGALSLLPEKPRTALFVMNGDLLTKVNFNQLMQFHLDYQTEATMCIREYTMQVPYGVVQTETQYLKGIIEKPSKQFYVSAGIYIIEPELLDLIPKNTFYDIPQLFEHMLQQDRKITVFPIREYWIDIGRASDFEQANQEHAEVFQ